MFVVRICMLVRICVTLRIVAIDFLPADWDKPLFSKHQATAKNCQMYMMIYFQDHVIIITHEDSGPHKSNIFEMLSLDLGL